MHSNSILKSNLLDIIFENRNKDYGAYILRKNYNRRLLKSLLIMLALVILFIFLQAIIKGKAIPDIQTIPVISDPSISNAKQIEKKPEEKKIISPQIKSKATNNNPVIVKDKEVKKEIIPNIQATASATGDDIEPPSDATGNDGNNTESEKFKEPVKQFPPVVDKSIPVNSPEVLPQFPGGMNELIKFLKRNLTTPREMDEEKDIVSVKVKFIVNYNGELTGFDMVETGGAPFDNEVIRVLKKMPKWIPGKNLGENVSTYFIIPVKFTTSD